LADSGTRLWAKLSDNPDSNRQRCSRRHLPVAFILLAFLLAVAACGGNEGGDQGRIEAGKQVYLANCAACHGAHGEGGPNWLVRGPDGRYPPPPHDSTGHTWHHGDGLLFRIVKHGGASLNLPGFESGMPAFEGKLQDDEVNAVISYLKTLWGPGERGFQAEVSKADPFP
jgi:mono/diheme cytochrome c family protein